MKKKTEFVTRKLDLQFFAEPTETPVEKPETDPEGANTSEDEGGSSGGESIDYEAKIAQLMADNAKLKRSFDKASSDVADYKKKYRETLSEKEKVDLEKAEKEAQREAELEQLKRESALNKMAKGFISMGYSEEQAAKASEAQLDGDYEEVQRIHMEFLKNRDKLKEAEWMKNMPAPPTDNREEKEEDLFLKGFGLA